MSRLARGAFIVLIVLRYGLDELVLSSFRHPWLRLFTRVLTLGRNLSAPRGERLRVGGRAGGGGGAGARSSAVID